jgi:putative radical SAM enzyme (TIGR03279 family)
MKIIAFENQSTGSESGFQIGDDLIKINGHPIRDEIDFQYHASEEYLEIEVIRNGEAHIFEIEKDYDDFLGIIFEETKFRCCGNNCIFCFVDQNPRGLRESLYFKDEDFRLSFLYGNYVTLTNVSRADLQRIVEQRLSPLYVSVHSTDLKIRKLMLGIKKDDHLLEKIRFLTKNRIELHAQIVLCPGINDGESLNKTIEDLAEFYPHLKSIAIVPVGLTKHRQNLYPLKPVTPEYAKSLIFEIEKTAQQFQQKWENYFVYLADEFYLLAYVELPPAERYDEFPQVENGVGMARDFIDRFEEQSLYFPHRIKARLEVTLVSSVLAAPIINRWVVPRLNQIENLTVKVQTIVNEFYGNSVTVTGLLTGQDIYSQLQRYSSGDVIVLPANCLNFDGIFLDDWTPAMLQDKLRRPVEIVDNDFITLIQKLDTGY